MRDDAAVQAIELVARATVGITTRALAEATPGLDLSLLQWRALLIVGDDPAGARVGRVRDVVGVPLPAASRLVRRLQRRGLVHVERDPDDGRATRVRLTHAGSHTRSTILARRHHLIAEALGQTVLSAEAVNGLFVVAERLERMSREIPAHGTGLTGGPEGRTMNESDAQITETDSHETIKTGSFAAGEEQMPEKDAEERRHRGSFASGEEQMLAENAEQRIHARGGFAVGSEEKPEEDAEKRAHPGTFADTEPADTEPADTEPQA
jgi:DNA-binding MarR family transcriptional regulator